MLVSITGSANEAGPFSSHSMECTWRSPEVNTILIVPASGRRRDLKLSGENESWRFI